MTVTTERRITHDELHAVVLACRSCGAETALDFNIEKHVTPFRIDGQERLPSLVCGVCGMSVDSAVVQALADVLRIHQRLRHVKQVLIFRIPEPAPPK